MKDSVPVDELIGDVERACADAQTPAWVAVLLKTVLALLRAMQAQFEKLDADLATAAEENAALRKQLYGQKSEKRAKTSARSTRSQPAERPSRRGPLALDAATLAEQLRVHEVPDAAKVCGLCGGTDFVALPGGEESAEYEYVPAQLVRVRHIRKKCACKKGCGIVTAPAPPRVMEGGRFGAGLYADVITKRSLDAIPFHRQADIWQRAGVPLSASTICDLFHDAAGCLEPVYRAMAEVVRESRLVHADETPQPVIDIGKTRRSYVWTFASPKMAVFVHSASRSGQTPKRMLDKTVGTLVADAYSGYNVVEGPDTRERAGCLAHCRRKFIEAESQAPEDAAWMVDRIARIYAVESLARERGIEGTAEHLAMRHATSRPLMDAMKAWLDEKKTTARPKSAFGKAVSYTRNQWPRLTVFLDDPEVPPDNNHAERLLRRVALGRKTSLFVGGDDSGQRYAVNMSIVASCKLAGIDPAAYLTDVLLRLESHPNSAIRDILPDRWRGAVETG
jgi:transposase